MAAAKEGNGKKALTTDSVPPSLIGGAATRLGENRRR